MKKLPNETLEALLNYLATRPYAEVFRLIAELSNLENIKIKDKPKKDGNK